jgi:hypothetical protein
MKILKILGLAFFSSLFCMSCNNSDEPEDNSGTGSLVLNFEHFADGEVLDFDEMKYINAAGNQYEVTEIQWFLSDITLVKTDGKEILLGGDKFAHYIDTNLPETSEWKLPEALPAGEYSSIMMTFGIKGEKNTPLMYTDPPEGDMLWPINLGGDQGGYHYMKLNGFWMNKDGQREPFNFHLGVGQERDADNNITGFIQNWFEVTLPASSFSLSAREQKKISIRMNVEKWWESPNVYDHDVVGSRIMQNQEAMHMGVENGRHVFSIGSINTEVNK